MKSSIWYISKYANIKKYGADTRQASFCKKFAEASYNVRLITSDSSHLYDSLPEFNKRYLDFENDGYKVTFVNTLKYSKATSLKRFLSWFWFEFFVLAMFFRKRYEKPDVVIASSLSVMSVLSGCFYKRFCKAKFIFEVRDIWPQTLIDLKGVNEQHPLVWFLSKVERLGYKYSDQIVGTMPGLHKHVEAVSGMGRKVKFIPQGVDLEFYTAEQQCVASDYLEQYFPKNKFVVTYAGTLGVAYSLDSIINAARILNNLGNTNIHFSFLGSGLEERRLKKLASGLPNVSFAPRVHKSQVLNVLENSDLLLHSFKMKKVFEYGVSPNKFIDYMYAKKPIICMFSGYPSMLNEANCGEFIPSEDSQSLADVIMKYSNMAVSDREKMGENGYNFLVKSRNFDVLAMQFMELFK